MKRLALLLALAASACEATTEIVVIVRSDLPLDQMAGASISVYRPDGFELHKSACVELAGRADWPRTPLTLGLRPDLTDLQPFRVVAQGFRACDQPELLRQSALVRFVPDERLALELALDEACAGALCPPATTCLTRPGSPASCASDDRPSLPPFDPTLTPRDLLEAPDLAVPVDLLGADLAGADLSPPPAADLGSPPPPVIKEVRLSPSGTAQFGAAVSHAGSGFHLVYLQGIPGYTSPVFGQAIASTGTPSGSAVMLFSALGVRIASSPTSDVDLVTYPTGTDLRYRPLLGGTAGPEQLLASGQTQSGVAFVPSLGQFAVLYFNGSSMIAESVSVGGSRAPLYNFGSPGPPDAIAIASQASEGPALVWIQAGALQGGVDPSNIQILHPNPAAMPPLAMTALASKYLAAYRQSGEIRFATLDSNGLVDTSTSLTGSPTGLAVASDGARALFVVEEGGNLKLVPFDPTLGPGAPVAVPPDLSGAARREPAIAYDPASLRYLVVYTKAAGPDQIYGFIYPP